MPNQAKKLIRPGLLFLFFVALFFMRFLHLGADAPRDLDPLSPGYICDPGNYAFNARLKILTGAWKIDDWALNYIYITPIPHYVTYLVFLLFGVGIAQMNVVPALFGSFLLVFCYLLLKRTVGARFALFGLLLLGASYELTMFSRVANRIMPMLFFAVLTIYLLVVAEKRKPFYFFWAGISSFIAFTAKATFLLVLPALLLGFFLYTFFQTGQSLKRTLGRVGFFCLGMGVSSIPWVLFFYLPNLKLFRDISADNLRRLTPGRFYWVIRNFWDRSLYHWFEEPLTTTVAALFLLFLVGMILRRPRQVPLLGWISAIWIVSNYAYLSCVYYRPLRHDLPLLLPAVFLTTLAFSELWKARRIEKPEKVPLLFYAFFWGWAFYTLTDLFLIRRRLPSYELMKSFSLRFLGLAFLLTLVLAAILRAIPRSLRVPLPSLVKGVFVAAFVGVYLFLNLKPYFAWAVSPRYDVRDISRDLGRAFEHMSIGGLSAPLMVMENQHIGHGYDYYIREPIDFLKKYGVTHLFLIPYFREGIHYWEAYPETMKRARIIARFPLWKTHFELWDLQPSAPAQEQDNGALAVYEGELFYGGTGIPRYDPTASGKYARVIERVPNNRIELGQISAPAGDLDVFFFLKTGEEFPPPGTVARIEVYASQEGRVLGSRKVSGRDFSRPGEYTSFRLRVSVPESPAIGLRVLSRGNALLHVDKVVLQRVSQDSPVSGPGDNELGRQEAR